MENRTKTKEQQDFTSLTIDEKLQKTSEALSESESKFKSIFDNVIDGILLADMDDKKIHDSNKAICRMLGYTREEIRNLSVEDIHPVKEMPYVAEQFEKQSKGEITLAKDIPVKRKDGSVFYADVNAAPVEISGKTYLLGIFRDITERKKTEKEIKGLAKFPEENLNPVYRVSKDGVL
ncbi:MAG: PAS domain S-box protein, partial [Candidatus Omnitrophica bacterium]|nr:PAS domain S-box protein [Candidatus Omnitrophota bacterium]